MPMEIEGQVRWPRPMGLGVVQTTPPQKKVKGVRVAVRAESDHRISSEEFALAVVPVLREQGLELVGEPKLVVDDSPIWVWRKMLGDKPEDTFFMAVVAAGPLKGHEGTAMAPLERTQNYVPETGEENSWKCKVGTPTVKDTAELPKFVEDWSVMARPVDLELTESKVRQLRVAMRPVRQQLRALAGGSVGSKIVAADVPAPKAKAATVVGTSAAIIGIALGIYFANRLFLYVYG